MNTSSLRSTMRAARLKRQVQQQLGISERRACRTLGQPRSTQRKPRVTQADEAVLSAAIVKLAGAYGRYGYRRVTELLRAAGWRVNAKRGQRIWRREGLKVPARQPKRGRLWFGLMVWTQPSLFKTASAWARMVRNHHDEERGRVRDEG
jgi:hypothetical protein